MRRRGKDSWELRVYLGTDTGTGRQRWLTKTVHGTLVMMEPPAGHEYPDRACPTDCLTKSLAGQIAEKAI